MYQTRAQGHKGTHFHWYMLFEVIRLLVMGKTKVKKVRGYTSTQLFFWSESSAICLKSGQSYGDFGNIFKTKTILF